MFTSHSLALYVGCVNLPNRRRRDALVQVSQSIIQYGKSIHPRIIRGTGSVIPPTFLLCVVAKLGHGIRASPFGEVRTIVEALHRCLSGAMQSFEEVR